MKVLLFEEFTNSPNDAGYGQGNEHPVPSDTMNKPCVDCDLVAKKIKKEIKRIDKIGAKRKAK